ncbi:hypothetical protein PspLS_01461 [Pyricularia sp. CBS 133598]|nr:hypothetical protein PspLS_01461 [Pyricularia sp. CBS 133598]
MSSWIKVDISSLRLNTPPLVPLSIGDDRTISASYPPAGRFRIAVVPIMSVSYLQLVLMLVPDQSHDTRLVRRPAKNISLVAENTLARTASSSSKSGSWAPFTKSGEDGLGVIKVLTSETRLRSVSSTCSNAHGEKDAAAMERPEDVRSSGTAVGALEYT